MINANSSQGPKKNSVSSIYKTPSPCSIWVEHSILHGNRKTTQINTLADQMDFIVSVKNQMLGYETKLRSLRCVHLNLNVQLLELGLQLALAQLLLKLDLTQNFLNHISELKPMHPEQSVCKNMHPLWPIQYTAKKHTSKSLQIKSIIVITQKLWLSNNTSNHKLCAVANC